MRLLLHRRALSYVNFTVVSMILIGDAVRFAPCFVTRSYERTFVSNGESWRLRMTNGRSGQNGSANPSNGFRDSPLMMEQDLDGGATVVSRVLE